MQSLKFLAVAGALALTSSVSHAVDGCEVLLCLAGHWQNITPCVPPVERAFRDAAFGHPFLTCHMVNASGGTTESVSSRLTEDNCPPMYSIYQTERGEQFWRGCRFQGVISISVNSEPWSDVFWSTTNGTSTLYYPQSLAAFATTPDQIDPRYANDLAAWDRNPHPGSGSPER